MPPFIPNAEWVGAKPVDSERLAARAPVLVHLFDFAQLNCVRALPYVHEWRERYEPAGLRVVGIHSPRFGFSHDPAAAAAGIKALGSTHPVALDPELAAWRDYGGEGWPSLFLFSKGGGLRWYHLGEGDYAGTERAIRIELEKAELHDDNWPAPMKPVRASDAEGVLVEPPTPELLPAGSPDSGWKPSAESEGIQLEYTGAGAYASVAGEGELRVRVDDSEPRTVAVPRSGLVELSSHETSGAHRLDVVPSAGLEIYSLSFSPGLPG